MLKNNKGFTIIELIASFVFTSILAISLFAVVLNYRDKEMDTSISARLQAFKSNFVIDVKQDFQKKGLESIEYCSNPERPSERLPRCVNIKFSDGDTKKLSVKKTTRVERLLNYDGSYSNFSVSYTYIEYGNIRYDIPDDSNVEVVTDYFLEETYPSDGLETNNPLYNIRIDLVHKDLPTNMVISIVASGNKYVDTSTAPYKALNIGDLVTVQLNEHLQRKFRVIQPSTGFEEFVTLLYDDVYDDPLLLKSTEFNKSVTAGNRYESSSIRINNEVLTENTSSAKWVNVNTIRLITADEVGYIVASCPKNTANVANTINLASAPTWLTNMNYWTMTDKITENEEQRGKMAWYVDGTHKVLTSSYVNQKFDLRPVIVVSKEYIAAYGDGIVTNITSGYICKKATTLHSTTCTSTNSGCKDTIGTGNTITFGTIPSGNPKAGDAYDCDVNNDGVFDSTNERFYYVTSQGVNSILIYSKNTTSADGQRMVKYAVNTENWHGPTEGYNYLPTTSEWSNPMLIAPGTRGIVNENSTATSNNGSKTIDNFDYSGKAARLLTLQELVEGCSSISSISQVTVDATPRGQLSGCQYLFENIGRFTGTSGTFGFWLETPRFKTGNYVYTASGSLLRVRYETVNDNAVVGIRPVITIRTENLEH